MFTIIIKTKIALSPNVSVEESHCITVNENVTMAGLQSRVEKIVGRLTTSDEIVLKLTKYID